MTDERIAVDHPQADDGGDPLLPGDAETLARAEKAAHKAAKKAARRAARDTGEV